MNIVSISKISSQGLLLFVLMLFICSPVSAANQVDIDINGIIDDTIRVCTAISLDISIENDFIMSGMSLGFKIWSDEGVSAELDDVGGDGPSRAVIVEPGSRLYPPESVFDMTGLIVDEFNHDGPGSDSIMMGGVGMMGGMQTGPLQHMLTVYMSVIDREYPAVKTICFDSCFIPPSGAFVFVNSGGGSLQPVTLWPEGGLCFPVGWARNSPPQFDEGTPTELVIDGCPLNTITLSATDAEADQIVFGALEVIGGGGEAIVDDHGDGTCDLSYAPIPGDVGQEITIEMVAFDPYVGLPCAPIYDVSVTVLSFEPLGVDCGATYVPGATNNPITKSDICGAGGTCSGYSYAMVSGPGSIDPVTGVYTMLPSWMDIGSWTVELEVSQDGQADTGSFMVEVVGEECCAGDPNFSGNVDVGDAIYLINYVFKGGPPPVATNWGDVNADCTINVGDIVYLINYVFNYGPEPQLGCVY